MKRVAPIGAAAVAVGTAVGAYARIVAPRRFEVSEIAIPLATLPAQLSGMRIGIVGDLHLGRRHGRAWTSPALAPASAAIRDAAVDLLVMVGDYGFGRWDPGELAAIAAIFEAPRRVAVLGNHDYGRGTKRAMLLKEGLESRGVAVVVNDCVTLEARNQRIVVAGLDDAHAKRADVDLLLTRLAGSAESAGRGKRSAGSGALDAALNETAAESGDKGRLSGSPFVILLCHSPDAVAGVPPEVFDIAFAGHTHGGQIAIPGIQRLLLRRFAQSSYDRGLYEIHGKPLFVTKGLGVVGYHARFRSRPEVAIVTLVAATDAALSGVPPTVA